MLKCICIKWIFNKNEQVLTLLPLLCPTQIVSTLPPNMEWKTKKLKKNIGTLMVVNGVCVWAWVYLRDTNRDEQCGCELGCVTGTLTVVNGVGVSLGVSLTLQIAICPTCRILTPNKLVLMVWTWSLCASDVNNSNRRSTAGNEWGQGK